MMDRLEILSARLRYLVSRNRWSARLLGAPAVVGHPDEPGLVLVQVDGLGERVLRRALDEGRMPFVRHLVEDEGYRLHGLYSGVPSNTPAFQAELFYGVRGAVPGFGFVDRESGREVAMTQQPAAAAVEARLAAAAQGLLAGGASWSNIFAGGSSESHFCSATAGLDMLLRALHPLRVLGLLVWHGWSVVRVLANLVAETIVALWDFARGAIAGRDLRAELRFVPERVMVSAVLREIVTAGACVDVERGVPVVHLNLLGYDEHAHRRGPDSRFALWALRGLDRTIRRVWLAAHRSRHRDYRIWIYSDHGQERVRPWSVVHGEDVADAIRRVWREVVERSGEAEPQGVAAGGPAPAPARGRRRPVPLGGRTERPRVVRQELPGWWAVGRAAPIAEPVPPPVPTGQPVILHRGPIGFVYLPADFDPARRDELAAALAVRAKVPTVLVADGEGGARLWTFDGGAYRLPGDADAVFGRDHPHLAWVTEDTLRLVHHRDAGEIVLWSWHPGGPFSFKLENGAHGGPGPRETGALLLVPSETAAHLPPERPLRPVDLRELARGAMDPRRSRLPSRETNLGRAVPDAPHVRVMTYNVHGCRGMDGRFSVERITRVVARARPDVVCLQELDQERARSGRLDQIHEIATRLAKSYRFHAVSEVDDGRFGNAVLSSLPLHLVDCGPLPAIDARLGLEPRGVLWVEVAVAGTRVQVLNTHLSIVQRERRLQVEELLGWVARARERGPVVLAGDLNTTRDSHVWRRLATVLHDVVAPHAAERIVRTWSGRLPLLRIDHVFASPAMRARRVDVPRTRLARAASDHLPVVVDLDVHPPADDGARPDPG
jgi:endonuclease/exonuclease/phosphatase family metal-dependent hydrolase